MTPEQTHNHSDAALPKWLLFGLAILATCFVLLTVQRGFPIAELDEGIILAQTIRARGITDSRVLVVQGYPPVIMGLLTLTQYLTEALLQESVLHHSGLVLLIVRYLAAIANLITLGLLFALGKQFKRPLVGLVAGLVWAILPQVNHHMTLALTEAWQVLFITASAWLMVSALQQRQPLWALFSTLSALLAVLSKYNAFPVLGFGIGTSLWFLLTHTSKKHWLLTLSAQITLIAITAYILVFGYGALDLLQVGQPESKQFVDGGILKLLNPQTLSYIFSVASIQLALPHLLAYIALLILGLGNYLRQQPPIANRVSIAFMLIFIISFIALVPAYLVYDVLKFRYISPTSSLAVFLCVLALWQMATWITAITHYSPRWLFGACVLLWMAVPSAQRLTEWRALIYPDSTPQVITWVDHSLEADTKIAMTGLEGNTMRWRYFNAIWGGYTGTHHDLLDILLYLQQPYADWQAAGIDYVHFVGDHPADVPPLTFPLTQMLYIKSIPPQQTLSRWRGDQHHIYRLQPPQYRSTARFDTHLRLIGYDQSAMTDDQIALRFFWQAQRSPTVNYQLFIHLSDCDEHTVLSQVDSSPALVTRPTSTWDDPDEILVSPVLTLSIPADIAAGEYRILMGLYDPQTGQRLMTDTGSDVLELQRVSP